MNSEKRQRGSAGSDSPTKITSEKEMTQYNDIEASSDGVPKYTTHEVDDGSFDEVRRAREIQDSLGILRSLHRAEEWLDSKVGIELQGVDRIPEEEKRPPSEWNIFLLWWSFNVHVAVLPLGVLGPLFGLSLQQTVAASIVGTILGACCTSFTGTLGPKLGLRQIACSRYSFGFWGAKLCSVLNVVVGGGFYVVNLVVVGQILSAVSDYTLSITVGIVIVAVSSYLISIFGFRLIHTFEKYSWIGTFIIMAVLLGQVAPYVDSSIPGLDGSSGLSFAGPFLTILAINFSFTSSCCTVSSDYYCNFPASTSSAKVFFLTFAGSVLPTTFSVVIGACLGNVAVSAAVPPFADAYANHGLGGLIAAVYHPIGWSKFCLVLLTFSVLGNNIAIDYSSGLSLQLLGHFFHAVPRFVWSFVFAVVVAVIAIAGQENLSALVEDFVSLLGYWTGSFTVILLLEDKVFRRHEGYELAAWDQPSRLPPGVAAVGALLAGYLAGGVTGMSQTWYVGPIARMFGEGGGDVGIYMSAAITTVVYAAGRTLEKRLVGR